MKARTSEGLHELRTRVQDATKRLHRVAARINALGLMSKAELRDYQRLLKRGADHRLRGEGAVVRARRVLAEFTAHEERFRGRLAEAGPSKPEIRGKSLSGTYSTLDRQSLFAEEADSGRDARVRALAERLRVAELMVHHHLSGAEALRAAGLEGKRTARWARKCARRLREGGAVALEDRRKSNGGQRTVTTDEIRRLIMAVQRNRPAAGPRAVARMVREECEGHGLQPPTESAVKHVLSSLPPGVRAALRGEDERVGKQYTLVRRTERASFAAERWQADHSPLDIWVKRRIGGEWEPAPVFMTVALDAYSRAIPGFFLSTANPDAHSIGLMLYHACRSKEDPKWFTSGAPHILQVDRGADFVSKDVESLCSALGTHIDPDPPNYPNAKGKVERLFRTLDTGLLTSLPGHKKAHCRSLGAAKKQVDQLLTLPELRAHVEPWIASTYHLQVNRRTGATPVDRWMATARPKPIEDETLLRLVLSRSSRSRTVTNEGVELPASMGGGQYLSPEMSGLIGRKVVLRFAPDYLDEVALYCGASGEFLCVAYRLGSKSAPAIEDIKLARNGLRRGVKQVVEPYLESIRAADRPKAHEVRGGEPDDTETLHTDLSPADDEVARLAARFEQTLENEEGG